MTRMFYKICYLIVYMNRRGFIFKIIIGILSFVILAIFAAGIYFYHFHTFKTIRVCLSENGRNTNITCETDMDCLEMMKAFNQETNYENTPNVIVNYFDRIDENSVYCNDTCYTRSSRGFTSQDLDFLDSCNESEIEIAVDIKGKDAIQIFKWLKN